MKLRHELIRSLDSFLAQLPGQTKKRGRNYHASGAVLQLDCLDPDHLYSAKVQGGDLYEVELEYDQDGWSSECSCPMEFDCKHVVAALLELRQRAINPSNPAPVSTPKSPAKAKPAKRAPQPPPSPLCRRLTDHLGRELQAKEAAFIKRLQSFYEQTSYRPPNEGDLLQLGTDGASNSYLSFGFWQPIELWPHPPADDFYCWLYVAHELRRRQLTFPAFMDGITDLNLIADEITEWEREKEVAHWKKWFEDFQPVEAVTPLALELRLMIQADAARLQFRTAPDAAFAEVKSAEAKRLGREFDRGGLQFSPDSLAIWSTVFKPWQHDNWWHFRYEDDSARLTLNRLLRLPLSPGSVVRPDAQPLPRLAGPLRFALRPPSGSNSHYELALETAEGQPAPPIYSTFSGRPVLYLTELGLMPGPSAQALGSEWQSKIPAAALETLDGLRFLRTIEIPLPEHLCSQVQTVPVQVTIYCDLRPLYPNSQTEDIVIEVVARAPGMKPEQFTNYGWQEKTEKADGKKSAPNRGALILHDRSVQAHFPRVLESLPLKCDSFAGLWQLRVSKKTPEVFVPWLKSLPPECEVQLAGELASLRDEPVSGNVSLDVTEAELDWFDLKVNLKVSDTTLTPEELKLLLNARGGYVRLGRKGWRRLQFDLTPEDDEQLSRLGLDARDFSGEPQRFHALQLADDAAKKFLAPERVEKIRRRVNELKTRVAPALSPGIRAELRPYQTEGYHFLAYLTANRFGGVLADDMGLGKTLQTLAWLAWLRETSGEKPGAAVLPSLVVCPKSVTDNWRAEVERFYPILRVHVWRGEPVEELDSARQAADLIVVNYAQLRSLSPAIAGPWHAVVLDEAQYIKNPDSQTAQSARALQAAHRLALTGTPIENRLLDLWSILAFAMPGALGLRTHFLRRFNAQDDPLARRRLAARVRPFLLRRTKMQVAQDLPDRVEEDVMCEMEGEQRTLYLAELKRARQILLGLKSKQQLNAERFNILTSLLRLRQICCHPALVNARLRDAESAKVAGLLDILAPLMEEGHKVLVFSQFVTMLDLLRQTIQERDWPHFYLAGDTENRGELVKEFQSAPGGAVFLISLKAGGFGLNLTAASYVVLFDPWWNPAVENQAIDRTHRIGQTCKVMAYRLLMRDSIEEKIRTLQKQKGALMQDVLGEERFAQALTLDDLRFLFAD